MTAAAPMPFRDLIGKSVGEMLTADIFTVRCHRCLLEIDAEDWQDHREKDCPVLFGDDLDHL